MMRNLARVLLGPAPGQPADTSDGGGLHVESIIVLIACVSFIAGVIHIGASIDHAQEFLLYTPVFALLAALQIAWAVVATRRPARLVLTLGCALNLAVIGLWVASRTVGLPIAPRAWVPESVGATDLMATLAESVIVIATACVLRSAGSPFARRLLTRLSPLMLPVIFVCVIYGLGAGHHG